MKLVSSAVQLKIDSLKRIVRSLKSKSLEGIEVDFNEITSHISLCKSDFCNFVGN